MQSGPRQFSTTHWSVIVAAGASEQADAVAALEVLCRAYWSPLYEYARRKGYSPDNAADMTQAFFAVMLEKHYLKSADQSRGRFRTFLLTAFQRFLCNQSDREKAIKRGGSHSILSLDTLQSESYLSLHPVDTITPEQTYERRWAMTLLARVLHLLKQEMAARNRSELFEMCREYLLGDDNQSLASIAESLRMTESAVKVAVHRMRKRYRELLIQEVSHTLNDENDLNDEIQHLLQALQ
ncbi:MAG: sigma-70 family RNA polymerase sigma factor [Planctomyces sp.]|nr:sigma-70 family RNA polymerase sigma factor [Planctomyces sp.]